MNRRVVAIVQARSGSTRLPNKVLATVLGRPMLSWVIERLSSARLIDETVVATTNLASDDELSAVCRSEGWPCVRGSELDVLDRYHYAAQQFEADVVVRITGDCPLIDPVIVDLVIATFFAQAPAVDYASNCRRRTYPRGLDTEVFSSSALTRAWQEDTRPGWREHVTPYLYKTGGFRQVDVVNAEDYSDLRWTVDTAEDLALVQAIYSHFGHGAFTWQQALEAMVDYPEWRALNEAIVQKQVP